jgi:hypothetical protein
MLTLTVVLHHLKIQLEEHPVIRWQACPTATSSRPLFGMPSESMHVLAGGVDEAKQCRNQGRWRR